MSKFFTKIVCMACLIALCAVSVNAQELIRSGSQGESIKGLQTERVASSSERSLFSEEVFSTPSIVKDEPTRGPGDVKLSEGFEGTTGEGLPTGWTRSTTSNYYWRTGNSATNWGGYSGLPGALGSARYVGISYVESANSGSWLWTPPMNLTAGVTYSVSFYTIVYGYPDFFEYDRLRVSIGTAASAVGMTTTLWETTTNYISDWTQVKLSFTPTTTGNYYLGFFAFTPVGQGWFITIDNVEVKEPSPNDLAIIADAFPYTQMPVSQMVPALTAKAVNVGENTQTNVVFSATMNGSNLGSSTPIASLASGATSATMTVTPTASVPLGNNTLTYTVSQSQIDDNPSNNTVTQNFLGTENTFALDNDVPNGGAGNSSAISLGNVFAINQPTTLNAAAIRFGGNAVTSFSVSLYEVNSAGTGLLTPALFTQPATKTTSEGWVTVMVPATTLTAGKNYFLCANQTGTVNFGITVDRSPDKISSVYYGTTFYPNMNSLYGQTMGAVFVRMLVDLPMNDLSASLYSATPQWVGNPSTYTVTVFNAGLAPQSSYTVQLLDGDDNVLDSQNVSTTLASGASANFNFNATPVAAGNIVRKGKVILVGDQNPDDNISAPITYKIYPMQPMTYGSNVFASGIGTGGANTLSAAISYLVADMTPFVGKQISTIEVGLDVLPSELSNCTVWIRNSLTGANIYSQPFTPTARGWNEITLTTPYILTNANTYIGYTITTTGGWPLGTTTDKPQNAANGGHIQIGTAGAWQTIAGVPLAGNNAIIATVENAPGMVTITTDVNPTGAGTVTGGGNYFIGNPVTLTAIEKPWSIFVNWTPGNVTTNPWTFNATEDITYTANFSGTPPPCDDYIIGTGTVYHYALPTDYMQYSYTQQIYLADEIDFPVGAMIEEISFQYMLTTPHNRPNMTFYLGNTSKTAFSGTTDWILLPQLQQVFQGTVNFNNSGQDNWYTITLNTPFEYTGENLVVVCHNAAGSQGNTGPNQFRATAQNTTRSIFHWSSTVLVNPASPPTASGTNVNRNNMKFYACIPGPEPCKPPQNLSVEFSKYCETATISWDPPNQASKTFSYTGAPQSVELQPGTYEIEVWGADGGNAKHGTGGKGGYSKGTITVTSPTTYYVYVGGKGNTAPANGNGGWNGGGVITGTFSSGNDGGTGGGGTDIRTTQNTTYANRIIVGGGGGGADGYGTWTGSHGGAGGGLIGGAGVSTRGPSYIGQGATQTAGGAGGTQMPSYNVPPSGFGVGGGYNGTLGGCAGGGGWYGGGSGHWGGGSGAGSGYIGGVTDGVTIRFGESNYVACPDPSGNGYAKIKPVRTYNIYRDEIKIAGPIMATTYIDETYDNSVGHTWSVETICEDLDEVSDMVSITMPVCEPAPCDMPQNVTIAYTASCGAALTWDPVNIEVNITYVDIGDDFSWQFVDANASTALLGGGSQSGFGGYVTEGLKTAQSFSNNFYFYLWQHGSWYDNAINLTIKINGELVHTLNVGVIGQSYYDYIEFSFNDQYKLYRDGDLIFGPTTERMYTDNSGFDVYESHLWGVTRVCTPLVESEPAVVTLPHEVPAPVATEATNRTCTSFVANWNAVTEATGYLLSVYLIIDDEPYYVYYELPAGTLTSYLISGLDNETTYYYVVKSITPCLESVISNEITSSPLTYTITASTGANGDIAPIEPETVFCGNSSSTYTFTPDECYEIAQVLIDGTNDPAAVAAGFYTFENVTDNHTIAVSFTIKQYEITATAGTQGTITPTATVDCGDSETFYIEVTDNCYVIGQVLIDGENDPEAVTAGFYTFENVTEPHTIEVIFQIKTFTIVASAGPNGYLSPSGLVTVECGADQTFYFGANTGYEIAYVTIDGEDSPELIDLETYTFENVTGNHSITVIFQPEPIATTFNINAATDGNATITPSGDVSVAPGANQMFTFTAKKGYEIIEVLINGDPDPSAVANGFYLFENVQDDYTIFVVCDEVAMENHIVHVTYGQGGSIAPNGDVIVEIGEVKVFNIIPKQGYKIDQVWIDGVLDEDAKEDGFYTFEGTAKEHWIHATFTYLVVEQYYINASVSTVGGTIFPAGKITVETGDEPEFIFFAQPGYQLKEVLVDGINVIGDVIGGDTYIFEPIVGSHTIVGRFEKLTPTITATNLTAGGTISPIGVTTLAYGGSKAYTITAQTGFLIDEVWINGISNPTAASSGKYTFSNVIENQTIEASFKYRTYPITATQGANGMLTPEGTTEVNHGDDITYYIAPNPGYMIKTVMVNGKNNPGAVKDGFFTFTKVTAKQTISATFAPLAGTLADGKVSGLLLYPNPTSGELRVTSYELQVTGIDVYDVMGRKVQSFDCGSSPQRVSGSNSQNSETPKPETTIDISHLPTGVYFVRIKTETGVEMRKVIKK